MGGRRRGRRPQPRLARHPDASRGGAAVREGAPRAPPTCAHPTCSPPRLATEESLACPGPPGERSGVGGGRSQVPGARSLHALALVVHFAGLQGARARLAGSAATSRAALSTPATNAATAGVRVNAGESPNDSGQSHLSEMRAILAKVRINSAAPTRVSPYGTPRSNLFRRTFARIPPNALALRPGIALSASWWYNASIEERRYMAAFIESTARSDVYGPAMHNREQKSRLRLPSGCPGGRLTGMWTLPLGVGV
jgi:hypothetical protein